MMESINQQPDRHAESVAGGEVDDTVSEAEWMARSARGRAARFRQRVADLQEQVAEFEEFAREFDRQAEFWTDRIDGLVGDGD